jgi:hypothetical protein
LADLEVESTKKAIKAEKDERRLEEQLLSPTQLTPKQRPAPK